MKDQLFVGTRKGLFALRRNGRGWKIEHIWLLGQNVPMFLPDDRDGTVYAAISYGHWGAKIQRLDAGSEKWTECPAPAYPPKPADRPLMVNAMGIPEPAWKLEYIWSLETAGPDRPGALWCGTIPGGLFHSPNRGDSWELIRPLWDDPARTQWSGGGMDQPGIHSICVDPRSSDRVSVGVSCGGVWQTTDGGNRWACRATGMRAEYLPPEKQYEPNAQDPHRLTQSPSNPDVFWVQHHNGIFHTADGCANWREISGAFGFAVVVHPRDADTAWFVPGVKDEMRIPVDCKLHVARTRDGGKSFEAQRSGLPQEHAFDLVYRHGLDIDSTGDSLAFGGTTGSLYTTDDGGEHWTLFGHQLPPIYCVRFGRQI